MAAGDLTTVEKVRRYVFGPDATLDADEILADLITSSSAWAVSQIGRQVFSATYTETRDGDGTTRMQLDHYPVISVTSVTINGTVVPKQTIVNGDGWVYSDGGIDLVGYVFTAGLQNVGFGTSVAGVQNVVFVYVAGYATSPPDLEQAVIEHVALKYRRRTTLGKGSENGSGESVTYSDAAVIAGINDVLDRYRPVQAW